MSSSSSGGGGGSVKRRGRVGGRVSMASARSRRSVASDLMPVAEEDGMQQVRLPQLLTSCSRASYHVLVVLLLID